jgi:putative glutamine amidotransferase
MKPKILITTRVDPNEAKPKAAIYTSYIDAIYASGGTAFLFPHRDNGDILEIVDLFDGLLITGGEDMHSRFYNQPLSPLASIALPSVDETDLLLIDAFHKAHKPIFGICRGLQVLNVAFGGTLIQDIHDHFKTIDSTTHQQNLMNPPIASNLAGHKAIFTEGSELYTIFGKEYGVNTFHHQAIDQIANGFKITAISPDGLIEGIEHHDNIIAVQWHPERMIDDDKHLKLFINFITKCKANSQ